MRLEFSNIRGMSLPDDNPDTPAEESVQPLLAPEVKVRQFPTTPGVYLMKDAAAVVIYVGKAVNLRSRASSYFTRTAEFDRRTADLVTEIADLDYIQSFGTLTWEIGESTSKSIAVEINGDQNYEPNEAITLFNFISFPQIESLYNLSCHRHHHDCSFWDNY